MLPYFYIFILIHILFMGVLIMNKDKINQMFDEMLEESAKACKAEVMEEEEEVTEEEKEEAKKSAKEVLESFLSYIKSARFNNKIESVAKEYKMPKKIVKNHFIAGILRKVADVLHLSITITAEIIKYAVEFISAIITKIVDFCYTICIKLTNVLTLNCGSVY